MLAVMPVVANAQTAQQPKPVPQAVAPAPAQTSAAPAAQAAKAPSAANSQRFVTSDNFFRPGAKPQPAAAAPSAATPASVTSAAKPSPAIKPNSMPVPPRAPVAQVAPVVASQPAPAPIQPMMAASPSPASAPATNAAVDYVSGELTVVADNAPLGLVLKLIAAKTGAVVDLVPELQNEPVVARLGPSPVREVLTALLDSPRIDYIVLGEGNETGKLQRIVVRMRHSFALFAAANPRPLQPKQAAPEEEGKLEQNGQPISNAPGAVDSELAQQQRMANWQKTREAMRMAEIKQQAQDRENEKNNPSFPDPPPPPQDQPPDPPQNPPQENPPQR